MALRKAVYEHSFLGNISKLNIVWHDNKRDQNGLPEVDRVKGNEYAAGDWYHGMYLKPFYSPQLIKWFDEMALDPNTLLSNLK